MTADEVTGWDRMSRRLAVPFLTGGIIAQFAGYGELEELDWEAYRRRYDNIGRLDLILEAEGDSPNRYQASKQADVLMLFYLFSADELTDLLGHLGYEFDSGSIPETVDYYLARTSSGSTLSRVVDVGVGLQNERITVSNSAGARLTVMVRLGNRNPVEATAARTRSLASLTAVSGRPESLKTSC